MTPQDFVAIIQKIEKAQYISDEEIESALPEAERITGFLWMLGERFHFAWKELHHYYTTLLSFQKARKNDRSCKQEAEGRGEDTPN
jgi:hypothetical protein